MSPDSTQLVSGLALLTLVPVALYILDKSATVVALSLVSVGLVAVSLYLMFGPADARSPGETV
ncbi:MAG: hypothetical protein ABEJ40_09035 [Haloarculaceae archaeon]